MKKVLFLFIAFAVMTTSFAAFNFVTPPKKAAEVYVPIGKSGEQISLMDLSQINVKEFQALSGKKMSALDKVGFKITQRELRKSINNDGTLNNNKLNKLANKMAAGDSGFNLGGFALGFLLSLIGVLIAYVISDDEIKSRTKWAWIGFAASLAIALILAVL